MLHEMLLLLQHAPPLLLGQRFARALRLSLIVDMNLSVGVLESSRPRIEVVPQA